MARPPRPLFIRSAMEHEARRYASTVRLLLLVAFMAGLVLGSLLTVIAGGG